MTGSIEGVNAVEEEMKLAAEPVAKPFSLHDVRLLDGLFKQGQDIAVRYLLSLEADRLLAPYRKEAGLEPKAPAYGGWERMGIAGHSLGHYLSACALGFAATGDERFRQRVEYIVGELAVCQKAHGDGYVAGIPEGRRVFAEVARGEIRSAGFDLNGSWVPVYNLHKLMAGLRDAYRLCGNAEALRIERELADWLERTFGGLNEEQMQRVLACEHGGINEVLADLYVDTGDRRYLELSRRFHHKAILEPLAAGQDILPGKHANTQIPKLIGLARRYEIAGELTDRLAAEFFWDRVVNHHSYVTGGHCNYEYFGPPDRLNDRLSPATTETCNVYNMLKLTRHIFGWKPRAEVMDFYERALLNHIRATQHPDGRVIYNLSLAPGHFKEYQTLYESFTCCVGTGMENHVRYGEAIYFHNAENLWVNLFIASEVQWKERGVVLRQETGWPEEESTRLTVRCGEPQSWTLWIRHPFWTEVLEVRVNGELVSQTTSPSSYCQIRRQWRDGDQVEVRFAMELRVESMPDNKDRIAIFYGPVLLAADLGPVNDPAWGQAGYVPVLVTEGRDVREWVRAVEGEKMVFRTEGVGRPRDVRLVPFHRLHDRRYTVYLDRYTPEQWARREEEIRREEALRAEMEARTVDVLRVGEMQPERDHQVEGEKTQTGEFAGRKWRHAVDGGWFSFVMKVDAEQPNELVCTWWGGETGRRTFDILIDGQKLVTVQLGQNRPGEFWEGVYPIPLEWTKGKEQVVVKLQAHPGNTAGGLFGARMVRGKGQGN